MTLVDCGKGVDGNSGHLHGVPGKYCTLGKCVCKLGTREAYGIAILVLA